MSGYFLVLMTAVCRYAAHLDSVAQVHSLMAAFTEMNCDLVHPVSAVGRRGKLESLRCVDRASGS